MTYTKLEGETDEQLIYRVCADKDIIGSWKDVRDILNDLLDHDWGESAYRKKYQSFKTLLEANEKLFSDSEAQLNQLDEKIRDLEKAKVKYRDERNAWSDQNRIEARTEDRLDKLEEALITQERIKFPEHSSPIIKNNDNDILVILSDLHIGQTFKSYFGEYNSDIAKDRLAEYLEDIYAIQNTHKCKNCYVSLQGDMISGNIHSTLQVTNRENLIEQIKLACEYISSFIYELSNKFENVYVYSVSGNHSRLVEKKENAMHDERFDDLIAWDASRYLHYVSNVHFIKNEIDSGIAKFDIQGKTYISVHGDYDLFGKQGVSNLTQMLSIFPYAIIYGHLHSNTFDSISNIKLIRGGSLSGTGDQYTVEKRITGKPSQLVCVCDKNGILCNYPIEFA